MIKKTINSLVQAFITNKIINKTDRIYYKNIISGILNIINDEDKCSKETDVAKILNMIGDYATHNTNLKKNQAIDFITSIMLPSPQKTQVKFWNDFQKDPKQAWSKFNKLAEDSYYIKYDRIKNNVEWKTQTKHGLLQITINSTKPEKTPEEIINAKTSKKMKYPACAICYENLGFFGTPNSNSRQNMRIIEANFDGKSFFMHFSPYKYYNHHLIINRKKHLPMTITKATYAQQLAFVDKFPFYFIGSNSDIPIVGGSILSHAHFQGGDGNFPLFHSTAITKFQFQNYELAILNWPISTIRIISQDKKIIKNQCVKITKKWYKYQNQTLNVIPVKNQKRQNAITSMTQKINDEYHLYLMLRNNGTSQEFPSGIFHFHEDKWNIKKENIGLIEGAGKAILPSRLITELEQIKKIIRGQQIDPSINIDHHHKWIQKLKSKWKVSQLKMNAFLQDEIGLLFSRGLEDCGVFYNKDKEFKEFINSL